MLSELSREIPINGTISKNCHSCDEKLIKITKGEDITIKGYKILNLEVKKSLIQPITKLPIAPLISKVL